MKRKEMEQLMDETFGELQKLREAGQKEYAHDTDNAFRNFEAIASRLNISQEKVLWIYLTKHMDGILAHINGHTSQREDVTGRIHDAVVYLCLLKGMIVESRK